MTSPAHCVLARQASLALLASALAATAVACGRAAEDTTRPERATIVRFGDDALASGGEVAAGDSITGDLMAAGGELRFTGATGGDYLGAGGDQRIAGRVHGDVRAAGGNVVLAGSVDRNITIAAGNVELDSAAVVGLNAYLTGGSVRVHGTVRGALQAMSGQVVLNGPIGGDVNVSAGQLRVGPGAVIEGNLRHRVPAEEVRIDPAARITGQVIALPVRDFSGFWRTVRLLWALGFLIAGAALVALFPGVAAAGAATVREQPAMSIAIGAAWLLLLPVVCAIVAMTLIGIPLAVIALLAWLVLAYIGRAILALWLGSRLLGARLPEGRWGAVVGFALGAVLLLIVRLVPVLGALVMFAATIVGIGALLVGLWNRARVRSREAPLPAA